ncbi:MAG: response regulator transcription factor [Dehalococcoides mccartyi]|uniref:response regulator transcription factor n=1 Tax=Dehalococcoides mccartyi TaxID=61435 RepID=UPI0030FA90F3
MKILIICNDSQVLKDLVLCLKIRYQNLEYTVSDNISDGIGLIETISPDIIFLDACLCDAAAQNIIISIREFSDIPIIILNSIGEIGSKVQFLEDGADECVEKPINGIECQAVTNALLRRNLNLGFKTESTIPISNGLEVNFNRRELTLFGSPVHLTPIEFSLLAVLTRNSGQVLTYRILLEKVWGTEYSGDLNLLKKHIHNLRSKIETNPEYPKIIITERGLGYSLIRQF